MDKVNVEFSREEAQFLRGYIFGQIGLLKGDYYTSDLDSIQSKLKDALKE